MTNDTTLFLGQWIRSPGTVGAVAPSSRRLAETVTTPVPHRGDPVVVELGPGTGAFTAEIQRRLGGRGHHMAVEINPRLAEFLSARHPKVDVVVEDAARLPQLLQERGFHRADAVVSGLPWAAFSEETQTRLMDAVVAIMDSNTAFTTFAYSFAKRLPPAQRFRQRLLDTFEEVVVGRTVWGNLPPAFVYHARRPREQVAGQG
ncbi:MULTISPECIES: class I SAM-dependent methyltransferase [Streptosporangium]|uniref:Phospholipid N-methyltransferase n=1 Tax=Streptosporangium brasiliense TaxID=47480 RepID=A0ABT9RMN0_9ACTN|nr:methyltransferase domain-containing protein [Streptosporangium brasiliense]MDP9869989.1 phospholipid N-methyltransferase [Streptosporangium brasiliense]